jgi:DNA-binding transcriptional ArsR family regulator
VVSNVHTDRSQLDELCQVFRLLSDPTRLRILTILSHGERHVTSLCQTLELPQPTVSHHLSLLRMAGITTPRRHGKQVFYRLNPDVVDLEPDTRAIRMRQGSAFIALNEPVEADPVADEPVESAEPTAAAMSGVAMAAAL